MQLINKRHNSYQLYNTSIQQMCLMSLGLLVYLIFGPTTKRLTQAMKKLLSQEIYYLCSLQYDTGVSNVAGKANKFEI
jgi:hypothetical protein